MNFGESCDLPYISIDFLTFPYIFIDFLTPEVPPKKTQVQPSPTYSKVRHCDDATTFGMPSCSSAVCILTRDSVLKWRNWEVQVVDGAKHTRST